ncbi:tubulin-like doman-containing protein [Streptomonospora nanhaiensis]|uniref:Tubulin-like doman-containing protein n=1 Tax=Streptomonospora nanhaiensis TaxID=1323731 RepID=A0ABY6YT54_9ACTN|nr:tubulin-like doman-containing protein [Streptomonospora nanhaiensis]WAE75555.1 tubulin-like doman-containing protein [Streptomonospora nanhaiensis]
MTMKLYQPLLYVGLGGTGCRIGAELERRMREEFCGPDGTEFQRRRPGADLLPYQLPSCVQFVYADVSRSQLDAMPSSVVPGRQYFPAVERTAHYVRDLLPEVRTYPEAARSLRLSAGETVGHWLPPEAGEPRVAPLDHGAGQFPTVGRAALFETFRGGVGPAVAPLHEAINRLATSAGDLAALGGALPRACDVFVSFSVAGGTGAGIFYDYLHLIARAFERSGMRIQIYPLVLMPSSFDEGFGGGRNARLNAGRALLDLFRLVDDQNGREASLELADDTRPSLRSREEACVHYPVEGRVQMASSTMQTAFLFNRPTGTDREDLHRSVVSLMLSLAGTDPDDKAEEAPAAQQEYQSFADSFINGDSKRGSSAETGIGNQGVSTALVASMTVPVDEIADIIGSRLLRSAVEDMQAPMRALPPEQIQEALRNFFSEAQLHPLLARTGIGFAEPQPADGAKEVAGALYDRGEAMKHSLAALRSRLAREAPDLARSFDHRAGVRALLSGLDPFQALRVLSGDPRSSDPTAQLGVLGLLQRRRDAPPPPEGMNGFPALPEMRDRLGGLRRIRFADPEPSAARARQDAWYDWQTRTAWSEAWAAAEPRWKQQTAQMARDLPALVQQLDEHARADRPRFERLSRELYRQRTGVSYLLPPSGGDLEPFFARVREQVVRDLHESGQLHASPTDAELVQTLLGPHIWAEAFGAALESGPAEAVAFLRERLKTWVKSFLRDPESPRAHLLPRLADLLSHAAGQTAGRIAEEDLARFRAQVAGLLPVGYDPQGNGPLKILISYDSPTKNAAVEQCLREMLNLPRGAGHRFEYRVTGAESISVVLFRSSMGITEVPEVREVMRLWSDALIRHEPGDHLPWRQRLGYDFSHLATTERHRVRILQRLLSALWNGRASVVGDPSAPDEVRFTLGGGVTMPLRLAPLGRTSSWGSLLQAYERWAFTGEDGITGQFSTQLMREVPFGVDSRPEPPHPVFEAFCRLADDRSEARRLERMAQGLPGSSRGRLLQARDFWELTVPAAMDLDFTGVHMPLFSNLGQLRSEASASGGGAGHGYRTAGPGEPGPDRMDFGGDGVGNGPGRPGGREGDPLR